MVTMIKMCSFSEFSISRKSSHIVTLNTNGKVCSLKKLSRNHLIAFTIFEKTTKLSV